MQIKLPEDVNFILTSLTDAGYSAFIVGGCVRDSIMGITPKDWDITTSALTSQVKAVFLHTFDTGIQHGTVTVLLNKQNYEVTTFRIDGEYLDGRRPEDVTFTTDLEADLSRRDFTINAIAYNPDTGLTDPFGGIQDIDKKIIRCVGTATERFTEDALRMMRAIRFSAQLGFDIDQETYEAIPKLAARLKMVSIERIREELTKTLASPYTEAILLFKTSGIWGQILPNEFDRSDLFDTVQVPALLKNCPKEPAMLYTLFGADKKFMQYLKFDNHTIKETALYRKWLTQPIEALRYDIKIALNAMGQQQFYNLVILKKIVEPKKHSYWDKVKQMCDDIIKSAECFTIKDLAVNGDDLIKIGLTGKQIGDIMADLLDKVMQDPTINKKEPLIAQAKNSISIKY